MKIYIKILVVSMILVFLVVSMVYVVDFVVKDKLVDKVVIVYCGVSGYLFEYLLLVKVMVYV